MWQIWAIVAAVMVAVEIFTAGFAAICLAIGAVASAVTAALGFGVKAQIIWFAVFTLFSFVVVRPIAIKMFFHKDKNARKSGVDALIGRVGWFQRQSILLPIPGASPSTATTGKRLQPVTV